MRTSAFVFLAFYSSMCFGRPAASAVDPSAKHGGVWASQGRGEAADRACLAASARTEIENQFLPLDKKKAVELVGQILAKPAEKKPLRSGEFDFMSGKLGELLFLAKNKPTSIFQLATEITRPENGLSLEESTAIWKTLGSYVNNLVKIDSEQTPPVTTSFPAKARIPAALFTKWQAVAAARGVNVDNQIQALTDYARANNISASALLFLASQKQTPAPDPKVKGALTKFFEEQATAKIALDLTAKRAANIPTPPTPAITAAIEALAKHVRKIQMADPQKTGFKNEYPKLVDGAFKAAKNAGLEFILPEMLMAAPTGTRSPAPPAVCYFGGLDAQERLKNLVAGFDKKAGSSVQSAADEISSSTRTVSPEIRKTLSDLQRGHGDFNALVAKTVADLNKAGIKPIQAKEFLKKLGIDLGTAQTKALDSLLKPKSIAKNGAQFEGEEGIIPPALVAKIQAVERADTPEKAKAALDALFAQGAGLTKKKRENFEAQIYKQFSGHFTDNPTVERVVRQDLAIRQLDPTEGKNLKAAIRAPELRELSEPADVALDRAGKVVPNNWTRLADNLVDSVQGNPSAHNAVKKLVHQGYFNRDQSVYLSKQLGFSPAEKEAIANLFRNLPGTSFLAEEAKETKPATGERAQAEAKPETKPESRTDRVISSVMNYLSSFVAPKKPAAPKLSPASRILLADALSMNAGSVEGDLENDLLAAIAAVKREPSDHTLMAKTLAGVLGSLTPTEIDKIAEEAQKRLADNDFMADLDNKILLAGLLEATWAAKGPDAPIVKCIAPASKSVDEMSKCSGTTEWTAFKEAFTQAAPAVEEHSRTYNDALAAFTNPSTSQEQRIAAAQHIQTKADEDLLPSFVWRALTSGDVARLATGRTILRAMLMDKDGHYTGELNLGRTKLQAGLPPDFNKAAPSEEHMEKILTSLGGKLVEKLSATAQDPNERMTYKPLMSAAATTSSPKPATPPPADPVAQRNARVVAQLHGGLNSCASCHGDSVKFNPGAKQIAELEVTKGGTPRDGAAVLRAFKSGPEEMRKKWADGMTPEQRVAIMAWAGGGQIKCDLVPGQNMGTLGGSGTASWYLANGQCQEARDYGSASGYGPFLKAEDCQKAYTEGYCG